MRDSVIPAIVDVQAFRTNGPAAGLTGYRIPAVLYMQNAEYRDFASGERVRSIGLHRATLEIHASTSRVLANHPMYRSLTFQDGEKCG